MPSSTLLGLTPPTPSSSSPVPSLLLCVRKGLGDTLVSAAVPTLTGTWGSSSSSSELRGGFRAAEGTLWGPLWP